MKTYLIRGIPLSMQQDGWWMSPPQAGCETKPASQLHSASLRLAVLAALILCADILLWGIMPGLSLAVFAGICVAAALMLWPGTFRRRNLALGSGLAVLSALPVVELVQPLSLLFFFAGLPVALAVLAGRRARGSLRFWWAGPWHSLRDTYCVTKRGIPGIEVKGIVKQAALTWGLPLGVGLIFASLLLEANPVLHSWVEALPRLEFPNLSLSRSLFWVGLAVVLWPVLTLARFATKLSPDPRRVKVGPRALPRVINGPAITRSLVLFNLMFAMQNAMDVAVLSGGTGLPEGMTYATYAQRGAYPLVVLALLAGAFAMLARPFITAAPVLRFLLLVFMAQTVWLTCSAGLRLDLYVEAYGLTRLRLSAGIWIATVAAGLALTFWQILRSRSNHWLLQRCGLLGITVLYACCFVSFDKAIAQHSTTNSHLPDRFYICHLGEAAQPVLLRHWGHRKQIYCDPRWGVQKVSMPNDWREWGFRNARVRRSLAAAMTEISAP